MRLNTEGKALLKEMEGFRANAYPDPASGGDPWTIGYGFTDGVEPGDYMSRQDAEKRLDIELQKYEIAVWQMCTIKPNENQFAALVVCEWNIGITGLRGSSILKAHNRGDFQAAARAFSLWNKATVDGKKKAMPGLTRRRAAEAALYLKPPSNAADLSMPQAVESESNLARSPIIGGSVVTGAATVGMASQVSRDVRDIRDNLGDLLPWAIAGAAVVGAGIAIFYRVKQRTQGWA